MKFNNENETKEMGFGAATEATPVSTTENPTPTPQPVKEDAPKQTPTGGNGGGNSFYERQQNNSDSTKWYSDWRGKTLGLSLAGILLIGAGIPLGMWMGGYWHDGGETNTVDKTEVVTAVDFATDEIERIYDLALLDHYDSLVYEGYITQSAHDRKIEDAEKTANDTIDNEKETLKANYGNTWEEEWDNSLKEKGFHTAANGGEDEYKDSMVASTIEESIKTQYTSKSALTSTVLEADFNAADYDFVSTDSNTKDKYYFIENANPVFYANGTTWADMVDEDGNPVSYSYTPEDLMNLFVKTYEPIVMNNSLMPFTPVNGANDTEADIQGDNVYMSNANVKSAWSFAKAEAAGTDPAAQNYGGIQKRYEVDLSAQGLSTESKIAIDLFLDGNTSPSTVTSVGTIVNAGFANVPDLASKTFDTVTSTDIENMNSNDVQLFGEGVSIALQDAGLLTKVDDTTGVTTKRNFATTGLFTANGVETVSFVSTNGLNNVGVSFEDAEVIVEQLDNYAGVKGAIDLGLVSTFNTWLSTSFKYITIIDYLTNPVDSTIGWFDAGSLDISWDEETTAIENITVDADDIEVIAGEGATEAEAQQMIKDLVPYVLFKDLALGTKNKITETYNTVKSFVDTNWQDYDATDFALGLGNDIVTFMSKSNLNWISDQYFTALMSEIASGTFEKNEVILNEGGDE